MIRVEDLPYYCTYFGATLSDSLISYIHNTFQEKELVQRWDGLLLVPASLRRNMIYLLLSDMEELRKRCQVDDSRPLTLEEVKTALNDIMKEDKVSRHNCIVQICQYLMNLRSQYLSTLSGSFIASSLLGQRYRVSI